MSIFSRLRSVRAPKTVGELARPRGRDFIGRRDELALFRRLAGIEGARLPDEESIRLLIVTGPEGSGKRALLGEFAEQAQARRPARCTPVIDLVESPDLELMLERIAGSLDPEQQAFGDFHGTLRKYRDRRAGKKSRVVQGAEAFQTVTTASREVVPNTVTGVAKLAGDATRQLAEMAEDEPRDLDTVKRDFERSLAKLARLDASHPAVLVFSDLDRSATHPAVLWLRTTLFPQIASWPVLVAVSVESEASLEGIAPVVPSRAVRLKAFTRQESLEFIERLMGISPETRLARELVEDTGGFPQRLARYREYYAQNAKAPRDTLTEEARSWAAGGTVFSPLHRLESRFHRRLLVFASPLRWFNGALLEEVAKAAKLVPDDEREAAADLLETDQRPAWLTSRGGGWGLDEDARRRAFLDECRRLDPAVFAALHHAAARYHRSRLDGGHATDGRGPDMPADAQALFEHVPSSPPRSRFEDDDYVDALVEWLYHLLAIDPERGFRLVVDHAAEAIFHGSWAIAERLLASGPELRLSDARLLCLRRLADLARAGAEKRYADTLKIADELLVAGPATDLLAAQLEFTAGTASVQVDRPVRDVVRRFEAANGLLIKLGTDDPRVVRMRCWNLTWLANNISERDGSKRKGLKLLGEASILAETLDEPDLTAEVHRARAIVLEREQVFQQTRKEYDAAISCLQRAGLESDMAYAVRDRAGLLLSQSDMPAARADFLHALGIYRRLEDLDGQATTLVELVRLELAEGDGAAAAEFAEQAVQLRPEDAYLHNGLGNVYFSYSRWSTAIEKYDSALKLLPAAVFFANRAGARIELAKELGGLGDPALLETHYRPALADYETANKIDPSSLRAGLERAKLERDLGNLKRAAEVAQAVGSTFLETLSAGGERRMHLLADERTTLTELIELLEPAEAAELLGTWAAWFARDRELHYALGVALRDRGALAEPDPRLALLQSSAEAFEKACLYSASEPPEKRAEYFVALADARAELRDWPGAHEAATQAAELDEGNAQARELLRRVRRERRRDSWEGEIEEVGLFAAAIVVEVAPDLLQYIDPQAAPENAELFDVLLPQMRDQLAERNGVLVPAVRINWNEELPSRTVRVLVHRIPRAEYEFPGEYLAGADAEICRSAGAAFCVPASRPWDDGPGAWVPPEAVEMLQAAEIPVWSVQRAIVATVESVIDGFTPSFVGAQYAAYLAEDRGWDVRPESLPRLVRALRLLAQRRTPLSALDAIVADVLGPDPGDPGALAERLGMGTPAQPPNPLSYALPTVSRATAAVGAAIVVRLQAGDLDTSDVAWRVRMVADRLCGALGLPYPVVELETDPGLETSEYEILVNGVTRFAGSLASQSAQCWLEHRAAGSSGRTGLCPMTLEASIPQPAAAVGRAVEAVLWDDPSLLLTEEAALGIVEEAGPLAPAGGTTDDWARALRQCAALRVPLGDPQELRDALQASSQLSLSDDSAPSGQRLSRHERAPERPIPDAFPLGIRDVIHVGDEGTVSWVRVRVNVRHHYPSDLRIRLLPPSGTVVSFPVDPFGYGEDVHLDVQPASLPELQALSGSPAAGPWTLHVQDEREHDSGTLLGWTLELALESDGDSAAAADGIHPGTPSPVSAHPNRGRAARLERLAQLCRPYEIQVKLGVGLYDALAAKDPESRLNTELLPAVERFLFQELGLSFRRAFSCISDGSLPALGFQIVINGLERATGDVPDPSLLFVTDADPEGSTAPLALDPESGRLGRWVEPGSAVGQSVDAGGYVIRQLVQSVREAGREFTDLAWTEQFLDRVAASFPIGIAALRSRLTSEMIASLLGRLVAAGLSMRDFRILDLLVDLDETALHPRDLDAAATEDSLLQSPATLAEYVYGRLAESAVIRNGTRHAGVELDAETEARMRESMSECRRVEQVYDFDGAGPLLRSLRQVVETWRDPAPPVVLASRDLRRHVARLFGAQFPAVSVLPRDGATETMPIAVVGEIGASAT